jgi:XTP/dITP diphosphohydrolase
VRRQAALDQSADRSAHSKVSEPRLTLLIGTHNAGKAAEISSVLRSPKITFLTLRDIHETVAVIESGRNYEENAILKAEGYARQSGLLTVADDSGLEVDVLDGAPGVLSARYAGAAATDRDRIDLLLAQLARQSHVERTARFVSVVAVADPVVGVIKCEYGICEGSIIDSPRGTNGFGYDPIFRPRGFSSTFAELPSETKDVISHRAQALEAMRGFLFKLIASNLTGGDPNS